MVSMLNLVVQAVLTLMNVPLASMNVQKLLTASMVLHQEIHRRVNVHLDTLAMDGH